jgi:phage baseplate assembly protein W
MASNKYIGSGLKFPIEIDSKGAPVIVTGDELIKSSIRTIISYPKGFRFFNNEFGCRVEELLGEPNDDILSELVQLFIRDSISQYEKRIRVLEVQVTRKNTDSMEVLLRYEILASGDTGSLIYPFYLSS